MRIITLAVGYSGLCLIYNGCFFGGSMAQLSIGVFLLVIALAGDYDCISRESPK